MKGEFHRYDTLPVQILAAQFDGSIESAREIHKFIKEKGQESTLDFCGVTGEVLYFAIDTLEGSMQARAGDMIIQGTRGEFYPCKPDVFNVKYEPANE